VVNVEYFFYFLNNIFLFFKIYFNFNTLKQSKIIKKNINLKQKNENENLIKTQTTLVGKHYDRSMQHLTGQLY
jgi:hypothetical protein